MMEYDLKPCPHCGRTPKRIYQYGYRYEPKPSGPLWAVDHNCAPGHGDSPEEAAQNWNTRHTGKDG